MNAKEYLGAVLVCLKDKNKKSAARLLWPGMVVNEQTTRIWDAMDRYPFLCIMGHGSASKSYTAAAWMLLDWWEHCGECAIVITSDTLPSMARRIWSDVKLLHASTKIPMPGILIDSRRMIKPTAIDEKNTIAGIAAESSDAQSKIQGIHTKHVRVVIDEADNRLSGSVWKAISNLETSGDLRCVALANPLDQSGDFGQHCEPVGGWNSIGPDTDWEWDGKSGWHVLRLDGLKSPNLAAGKDLYPFLLTNRGVEGIRQKEGENSPGWWSYVRAWFPPEGSHGIIFSKEITDLAATPIQWYGTKTPCASLDPAFEGGDACILSLGYRGRPASNPSKVVVQVHEFITIKRQDTTLPITIDFARQVIAICKRRGVKPENFIMDKTGNALGLHDVIKHEWSAAIVGIGFGEACTEMKITQQDTERAVDRFDRFVSELWYCAREWMRCGLVQLVNPPSELTFQLHARTYRLQRKKIRIQTKEEMKEEGLKSPDMADAFCLMIHLARLRANGFTPSSTEAPQGDPASNTMARFKAKEAELQPHYGVQTPHQDPSRRLPAALRLAFYPGSTQSSGPHRFPVSHRLLRENPELKGGPM